VRAWLVYNVYALGISPIPSPLDQSLEYKLEVEERLEDFAVWYATCRPSGRQASYVSIGKYVSSIRSWYARFYSAELGMGAAKSRIQDILKGYGRSVEQPPPRERVGCAPRDLAEGMAIALAGMPKVERAMWKAALAFGMSAMARAVELGVDSGRKERFDPTQHMTALDVSVVLRGAERHAAVRMRKRKNLRVLRGKDHTVVIAAGAARTSTRRRCSSSGWRCGGRRVSQMRNRFSATPMALRSRLRRSGVWCGA
jgi:hypothetical protein